VALFDRARITPVGRGENSGRTLTEFNIVRVWRKIGEWTGKATRLPLGLSPQSSAFDACAIILQEGDSGPVRGATAFEEMSDVSKGLRAALAGAYCLDRPEIAAEQLRSFTGSALEITASSFDLASLVNTEPGQIKLDQFENALRKRIDEQALKVYGITIRQVGLERLTLASDTLSATIERMKAERETVAAERSAQGQRMADQIRSNADRDSRVLQAQAKVEAADIEAKSRIASAAIYKQAYSTDPQLYTLLRSLESLDAIVGPNTRLILRTDAAPFRVLIDGTGTSIQEPTRVGKTP